MALSIRLFENRLKQRRVPSMTIITGNIILDCHTFCRGNYLSVFNHIVYDISEIYLFLYDGGAAVIHAGQERNVRQKSLKPLGIVRQRSETTFVFPHLDPYVYHRLHADPYRRDGSFQLVIMLFVKLFFDTLFFKLFMKGGTMFAVPVGNSLLQSGVKTDYVV